LDDKVFSASSIAAYYIKQKMPEVKKCFVVGMRGIEEEMKYYGIDYVSS
jgi:ribonucleotide monophosphatase NagD (HAD superfamily)